MNLLNGLTSEELSLAKGILNSRTNQLRASRPTLPKKIRVEDESTFFGYKWMYKNSQDADKGRAAYIWRMVAFSISSKPQHRCMPCTAEFYLEGTASEAREEAKRLDEIVNKIVNNVPITQQHGTIRWGKALGMI